MKRLAVVLLVAIIGVFLVPAIASAGQVVFRDNFNDGNTNGWWFDAPTGTPNWRVENGVLRQDSGGDWYKALVADLVMSSQSVETSLYLGKFEIPTEYANGYGGATLWYRDAANWISVVLYPAAGSLRVAELVNNVGYSVDYSFRSWGLTWYRLRVDANGVTGELAFYVDDTYVTTYNAVTLDRSGLSGLVSGNNGGGFDDFRIKSVPDPGSTLLLLGTAVAGLVAAKRRWR